MLALWIILGIFLFILVLLLIPVTLQADTQPIGRRGHLVLGYAFFRFDLEKLAEQSKNKKKAVSGQPKPKKEKGEEEKKNPPQIRKMLQIVLDFISSAAPPCAMVLRHVAVRRLQVSITVLEEDAQQTAVQYGRVCAFCGGALAVLENCLNVKHADIRVTPDFSRDGAQEKGEAHASVKISLLPIIALAGGVRALVRFLCKYVRRSREEKPPAHKAARTPEPGAPGAAGPAA